MKIVVAKNAWILSISLWNSRKRFAKALIKGRIFSINQGEGISLGCNPLKAYRVRDRDSFATVQNFTGVFVTCKNYNLITVLVGHQEKGPGGGYGKIPGCFSLN